MALRYVCLIAIIATLLGSAVVAQTQVTAIACSGVNRIGLVEVK